VLKQLLEEGFDEENIINYGKEYDKLTKKQYFDLPELSTEINKNEIFIDGGCFNGLTSIAFDNWCKELGVKGYSYAWEPDSNSYKTCKLNLENSNMQYELIAKGMWSDKNEFRFVSDGISSTISSEGENIVEVDSIDNVIDKCVTFIKMDVEGAEYQALLGAENTIKKYKPKLAICVYHKMEDIWELPQLIYEMNPNYTFYLRHYSFGDTETVLYAI